MTDGPPDPLNAPTDDDEGLLRDLDVEESLADWLDQNRAETGLPCATLYKFSGPTGEQKEQLDAFSGVLPSRHDIGLEYGSGRYLMIVKNTTSKEGRVGTSRRFLLHKSYDEKSVIFKREKAERERLALGQSNALPSAVLAPQTGKETLMEAFSLVRGMQLDMLTMFKPILERIMTPAPALPPPPAKSATPFEEYALTRQILKDNLKENVTMFSEMQRVLTAGNGNVSDAELDDEDLPDEKKSMFEKIIELAEPFINILAQNNTAARMAAAGIRAAPQFKEALRDVPLAKRIISYVEQKEGPERAAVALRNLGIDPTDYAGQKPTPRLPAPPVRRPPPPVRRPAPAKKVTRPAPKAGGVQKPATTLNPKMEVKP